MATKRMFSLLVTDTDRFMDMSASAQALYFHLGMHGDDDGFVASPRKIARSAGCNDDDLRLLAAKGYIIPFDSGVIVITDWSINNTLKNDRYRETIYTAEKSELQRDESGRYFLGTTLEPERFQIGSNPEPQHNPTKPNETEQRRTKKETSTRSADFETFWKAYPKKIGKQAAKKAFDKVNIPVETLVSAIRRQECSAQWSKDNGQYIPNPATWLNQGRWEDEVPETTVNTENPAGFIPGVGEISAISQLQKFRNSLKTE